jgi:hypothetical protein
MGDLGLQDIITILLMLAAVFAVGFVTMLGFALWPRVASGVRRALALLADEGRARRAYRQQVYAGVKNIDSSADTSLIVMSRQTTDEARTATDGRTDAVTDGDATVYALLRVDKSRDALIKVLVYSGWGADDIRKVVKGANDAIGAAVQAAKEDDDDVMVTPWAGRRTKASYYDDPRLEYQQPPN